MLFSLERNTRKCLMPTIMMFMERSKFYFHIQSTLKKDKQARNMFCVQDILALYLIEMPFNTFANIADPDQADQGLLCFLLQELPDQGLLCLLMEI